jgi:hypothetical protein
MKGMNNEKKEEWGFNDGCCQKVGSVGRHFPSRGCRLLAMNRSVVERSDGEVVPSYWIGPGALERFPGFEQVLSQRQ